MAKLSRMAIAGCGSEQFTGIETEEHGVYPDLIEKSTNSATFIGRDRSEYSHESVSSSQARCPVDRPYTSLQSSALRLAQSAMAPRDR